MRPLLLLAFCVVIHLGEIQEQSVAGQPSAQKSKVPGEGAGRSKSLGVGIRPIRLQVLVVELSVTKLRAAGVAFEEPTSKTPPARSVADRLFQDNSETPAWSVVDEYSPFLKTLEESVAKGHAKILCRQTIATVSGERASFRMGGEIPYSVQAKGGISIKWKSYGTSIEALAVMADKTASLDMQVCVSELDKSNGITADGTFLPALRVLADTSMHKKSELGQVLLFVSPSQGIARQEKQPTKARQEEAPNVGSR